MKYFNLQLILLYVSTVLRSNISLGSIKDFKAVRQINKTTGNIHRDYEDDGDNIKVAKREFNTVVCFLTLILLTTVRSLNPSKTHPTLQVVSHRRQRHVETSQICPYLVGYVHSVF